MLRGVFRSWSTPGIFPLLWSRDTVGPADSGDTGELRGYKIIPGHGVGSPYSEMGTLNAALAAAGFEFVPCPRPTQCPDPCSLSPRAALSFPVPIPVPTREAPETPTPLPATSLSKDPRDPPLSLQLSPPSPFPVTSILHPPPPRCPRVPKATPRVPPGSVFPVSTPGMSPCPPKVTRTGLPSVLSLSLLCPLAVAPLCPRAPVGLHGRAVAAVLLGGTPQNSGIAPGGLQSGV